MVRKITPRGWIKGTPIGTGGNAYDDARQALRALPWAQEAWATRCAERMKASLGVAGPASVRTALARAIDQLIALETAPYRHPERVTTPEETFSATQRLRNYADTQAASADRWNAWQAAVVTLMRTILGAVPPQPTTGTSVFSVPLIAVMTGGRQLVDDIVASMLAYADDGARQPGYVVGAHIRDALLHASEVTLEAAARNPFRLVPPAKSKLAPAELVETYLAGTPFRELLTMPLPITIPLKSYTEHSFFFAPSGWGKTTHYLATVTSLLEMKNPPALLCIDNTGDTLKKIVELDVFHPDHGRLRDRLRIYDPEDPQPPQLSFFDTGLRNVSRFSRAHQAMMRNASRSLISYLLRSLDREFTGQQAGALPYLMQLLERIEGATISTLLYLMTENVTEPAQSRYAEQIAQLDEHARGYFQDVFFATRTRQTRGQIASRLYALIDNEYLSALFNAPTSQLDLFDSFQRGHIVLVRTASSVLDKQGAALVGRYFLARAFSAAFQRATIPERDRHPALIFVDESGLYIDDYFQYFLEETRKYGVGLNFYAHDPSQATEGVRSALASTALKYAGPMHPATNNMLAPLMRTEPQTLAALPQVIQSHGYVMFHGRGITPNGAVPIRVDYAARLPIAPMSERDVVRVLSRNREVLAGGRTDGMRVPTRPVPPTVLTPPPIVIPGAAPPTPVPVPAPAPPPMVQQPVPPPLASAQALALPRRRPVRDFGQVENVALREYGLVLSALCDTGAQVSCIFARNIRVRADQVSFAVRANRGRATISKSIVRYAPITGVQGKQQEHPTVRLAVDLDGHSFGEEFVILPDEHQSAEALILGDTFWSGAPFQPRINLGERFLAEQRRSASPPWSSDRDDP